MEDKFCPIQKRDCMTNCSWRIHDECAITVIGRHFLDVPIGDIPEEFLLHKDNLIDSCVGVFKFNEELDFSKENENNAEHIELKRRTLQGSLEFLLDKHESGLITSDDLVRHLKLRLESEPSVQKSQPIETEAETDEEIQNRLWRNENSSIKWRTLLRNEYDF